MFENVDGRTTDAGVTGILIAHLGAFGSGELTRHRTITDSHNRSNNKQQINNNRINALERQQPKPPGAYMHFTGTKSLP